MLFRCYSDIHVWLVQLSLNLPMVLWVISNAWWRKKSVAHVGPNRLASASYGSQTGVIIHEAQPFDKCPYKIGLCHDGDDGQANGVSFDMGIRLTVRGGVIA